MYLFLMCLKIFFARICDVSLGTTRMALSIKGKTKVAALIAFIEVTIWFLVAREALTGEPSVFVVVAYAAGYAVGTLIGTFISKNFIRGLIRVEAITTKGTEENIERIKKEGYGISIVDLENTDSNTKKLLLITAKSQETKNITNLIKDIDPNAFIVINESKMVYNGFIK